MRTLSIAAMQTAPIARDPDATLERLAERAPAVKAAVPQTQLLVLPELHLSAVPGLLDESHGYADSVAVEVPGPLTERLGEIARDNELWVAAGSVYERSDRGHIHNTAFVVSPQGGLAASLPQGLPLASDRALRSRRRLRYLRDPGVGRLGLAICYDGFSGGDPPARLARRRGGDPADPQPPPTARPS